MPLPNTRAMRAALEEAVRRGMVLTPQTGGVFPRKNYCPEEPTPKQNDFLMLSCLEAMYGGAAGGGKSSTLLMAALQYVHVPGYNALILRRTYSDLAMADAIMDRFKGWIIKVHADVKWSESDKRATFPSGATITFGFLDSEVDKYRYQGAAFQFIAFDELTQFTETMYTYLFSRLRRKRGVNVPLRMRAASNPGGVGHDWVKERFITSPANRVFIRSLLADNPYLDHQSYMDSLGELDPMTKEQLLNGDWDVLPPGDLFKREFFDKKGISGLPTEKYADLMLCRAWDTAATEPHQGNKDPDWTVGLLMGISKSTKLIYLLGVTRFRKGAGEVERRILLQAEEDGKNVTVVIAEEGGSSGKIASNTIIKSLLGYPCETRKETGSKFVRAKAPAGQAQKGNIFYMIGDWNLDFFREIIAFTDDSKLHDDQVDALSLGFAFLAEHVKVSSASVNVRHGDLDAALQSVAPTGNQQVSPKDYIVIPNGAAVVLRPSQNHSQSMWQRMLH